MINNIPLELQNKIWNYYWQHQFYNHVIIYLKEKEYFLLKAFDFIKKHIFPQIETLNKKKYLEYHFHKINNFFISLHQENGLHLFLQSKYKLIAKLKSSGSRSSLFAVKPTISEKKTVSFLRLVPIVASFFPSKIDCTTCGDKYFESF